MKLCCQFFAFFVLSVSAQAAISAPVQQIYAPMASITLPNTGYPSDAEATYYSSDADFYANSGFNQLLSLNIQALPEDKVAVELLDANGDLVSDRQEIVREGEIYPGAGGNLVIYVDFDPQYDRFDFAVGTDNESAYFSLPHESINAMVFQVNAEGPGDARLHNDLFIYEEPFELIQTGSMYGDDDSEYIMLVDDQFTNSHMDYVSEFPYLYGDNASFSIKLGNVSVVPIPPALPLMLSALSLFGVYRKRK